ncbi:MAG: hypothetical protein IPG61_08600 [bacterium]|nr:hypothetical protein [bacterium]
MSSAIRSLLIAGACALLAAGCASYPAGAPPIDEMDAIQAADDCVCLLAGEELCADGFEVNGGWSEYDRRYRYTYRLWLADDRDHHLDFEVQVSERGRVEVVTRNGRTAPCSLGGNPTRDEFAIRPRRALEIALDAGMGDDEHPIHVTLAWDVIKERALWWVGHRVPAQPRPYEDVMVIDSQTGVVVDRYSEPIPDPPSRLQESPAPSDPPVAPARTEQTPSADPEALRAAKSVLDLAGVCSGRLGLGYHIAGTNGRWITSIGSGDRWLVPESDQPAIATPRLPMGDLVRAIADTDASGSASPAEIGELYRALIFGYVQEHFSGPNGYDREGLMTATGLDPEALAAAQAEHAKVVARAATFGLSWPWGR